MPLKKFKAEVVSSFVYIGKRRGGRPSLDEPTERSNKAKIDQGAPIRDTRLDDCDHLPKWSEKKKTPNGMQNRFFLHYVSEVKCLAMSE